MHLPRHTIESHAAAPLFQHASFCSPDPASVLGPSSSLQTQNSTHSNSSAAELSQPAIFSCATLNGFLVAQTDPIKLVANRSWSTSQGGLSHALPVRHTSLLFLVGGGRVPRFAPNKVILWDEAAEYTAKPPVNAAADGDSDDDLQGSIASRRASTIFSAGSEFDAYGRSLKRDEQHSSSSVNDEELGLTVSSLTDSERSQSDPIGRSPDNNDSVSQLDHSIGSSSLGIGRLQQSYLSNASQQDGTASLFHDDDQSGMASSSQSHSISASSANLADPFGETESPAAVTFSSTASTPPPNHSQRSRIQIAQQSATSLSPSHKHNLSTDTSRKLGSRLIDSVSSMATTATHATVKAQPTILRGREVAELEFSEAVTGIFAITIHTGPHQPRQGDPKGKGRASAETLLGNTKHASASRASVVLAVLLPSKAVVFEISPPPTGASLDGLPTRTAWKIQKRAVVPTFKNPKGLGCVAPFYGEELAETQAVPSAIVAVPGRQKGHVQLLRIQLGVDAATDKSTHLSNAATSAGAASIIVAHESSIAAITLSPNGRLLATASSKGTLIRVWSNNMTRASNLGSDNLPRETRSGMPGRTGFGASLARELRRGTDAAGILSIAFAPDASLVAAASDKGTIHIFLLADQLAAAQTGPRSDQQHSASSFSSTRAAGFGRAAAHYLPAGIGGLAGQIPPSVLPQYLKSDWSSAQFRIALKSFGASSRHYPRPSAVDDNNIYATSAAPSGAPFGTEKSTEGAWAQMRSRISDIRKGEASVEEKIFLCWILEPQYRAISAATSLSSRAKSKDEQLPRSERKGFSASHGLSNAPPADLDPRSRFRLIAVTTSGGWYKLAITLPSDADEGVISGSTVLNMYRHGASSTSGRRTNKLPSLECHLEEYRPMGALLDGWRA